jgi:hypothetical protein
VWYQCFTDYVSTLGFHHSSSDHSLFIYCRGPDTAFILLYVDDIITVTSSPNLECNVMKLLSQEFAMKDLGPLDYFLGVSVNGLRMAYFSPNHALHGNFFSGQK